MNKKLRYFLFALLLLAAGSVGFVAGEQHGATEMAQAQTISLVANVRALTRVTLLLEGNQPDKLDKALKWQKGYLGVLREELIAKKKEGLSSPEVDQLINSSETAVQ